MSEKKPTYDMMPEILKGYVKTDKGTIYHVIKHKKNERLCYLRRRNTFIEYKISDVKQRLVTGGWSSINEHEWKKFVEKDNAYIEALSQRLIKRIIIAQLLLEVNDELIEDNEDNKYLKNKLEKSNKECERIVRKNYDTLYYTDENMVQNVLNKIESLTEKLSKMNIVEIMDVEDIVSRYLEDPEKYRSETIEMEKTA